MSSCVELVNDCVKRSSGKWAQESRLKERELISCGKALTPERALPVTVCSGKENFELCVVFGGSELT